MFPKRQKDTDTTNPEPIALYINFFAISFFPAPIKLPKYELIHQLNANPVP